MPPRDGRLTRQCCCLDPSSSPGSAPPAASSPRTRRGCSSPRHGRRPSSRPWSTGESPACRSNTSSAGRSSAACGSPSTPGSSCRAAAPSSSSAGRRRSPARPDAGRGAVVVVDLCCGSGAVGAALAAALDRVELHAVDVDPAAVRCARRNLAAAGGRVYEGDLYEPLPASLRGRVDVLVANAPYVPTEAIGLLPAGGPRPRAAGGARRRRGRARRRAAGDRRGPAVAGARRPPAVRDERAPGAAGRRSRRSTTD